MEIYFKGEIGKRRWIKVKNNTITTLTELIELLNKKAPKSLTIHIESLGGSTYEAVAIYFYLKSLSIPITTICHKYVASAATIIAQIGDVRMIDKDAKFLIHNCFINGTIHNLTLNSISYYKREIIFSNETIRLIYKRKSNLTKSQLQQVMEKNNGDGIYLDACTALRFKLVDKIIE